MAELSESTDIREIVRERYAAAATRIAEGAGCGCGTSDGTSSCCDTVDADMRTTDADGVEVYGAALYGDEAAGATGAAVEASLGCGVPTAVAELHEGETVLDLGSGAGADVLISARRVGPTRLADRITSIPPPEPRSSTVSPSCSSATAVGLPQPSEASVAASGSSPRCSAS